ncbi:PspC domain-containing protein [Dehalococcoidia bacterium]|nr:PspC domain-containing protein [Dehalococcoidia bacterium]
MEKRLYRSRSDRVIWGVCGGLARHLNVDPTLVRLVMVLLVFANGLGILIYIIMAVIVPLEGSKTTEPKETMRENVEEIKKTAGELGEEIRSTFGEEQAEAKDGEGIYRWRRELIGTVLIVAGLAFLVENFNLFWFDLIRLWPLLLVGAGLLFILTTWRRRHE